MCTYSQLKKQKLYVIDISKCIKGGSIKLTTLVDYIYIYICVQSRMHFRVMIVFFLNVFN